jgi:hypothetical protein
MSSAALTSLSKPKPGRMHSENQLCDILGITSDPLEYINNKTNIFESNRARKEAIQAQKNLERNIVQQEVKTYKAHKDQVNKPLLMILLILL